MKYFFQKQMKQTLLYLITFLTVFPVFAEKYDLSRFEREILIKSSRDAIQFEVLANGDIVFVEFANCVPTTIVIMIWQYNVLSTLEKSCTL